MVLTAYFVLSPVTGLFCHRRLADTSAQLDASVGASGPHDFAVRREHRSSSDTAASTASRSTFVTTRTPLLSRRDGANVPTISDFPKEEYFGAQIWTTQISLIPLTKSASARTRLRAVFDRMRDVNSENRSN
jgi:hypothetical protein